MVGLQGALNTGGYRFTAFSSHEPQHSSTYVKHGEAPALVGQAESALVQLCDHHSHVSSEFLSPVTIRVLTPSIMRTRALYHMGKGWESEDQGPPLHREELGRQST